jgi:hypothetical protein
MGNPASGAEYWKSNCRFLDSRWSLGMTVLEMWTEERPEKIWRVGIVLSHP